MKRFFLLGLTCVLVTRCYCWGFYMHQQINYHAVFLLPPEMMRFYKPNIGYLSEHAVDPDKRRYAVASEGAHHFIDIDHYGPYPYTSLPHNFDAASRIYSRDSIQAYGIVPWWIQTMLHRLTKAFTDKDESAILKLSAEIGHYIADAHVPLHASTNHNGQLTHQEGIHAFWESRIPELLAAKEWDFFIGKAVFISDPAAFIWKRVLESGAAADTVLRCERELRASMPDKDRFAFEERNGKIVKQYSTAYTTAYNNRLENMVERRMRQSIFAVASLWFTAWVNAGQPSLENMVHHSPSVADQQAIERLNLAWKNGKLIGRDCE